MLTSPKCDSSAVGSNGIIPADALVWDNVESMRNFEARRFLGVPELLLLPLVLVVEVGELVDAEAAEESFVPAGEENERTRWAAGWKGDETGLSVP